MIPFLKQVADHYYNAGGIDGRCFIFPNRRSMIFFRKYLCDAVAQRGDAPLLLPQMLTINDFFCKAAGLQSSDRVRLLLKLYESYAALNPKAETLDEFIFWGDVILADFNDVDKYLVDAKQLFTNVADYKSLQDTFEYLTDTQRKAIEAFLRHFNDQSGRLTVDLGSDNPDVKGRFLQIWNILYPLYVGFNEKLEAEGMAYEGMAYRRLAMKISQMGAEEAGRDVLGGAENCVFVGLNALNECEKTLLRRLRDFGLAEFCWDWSGDMIRDPQNRSSLFMAENVIEFPQAAQWDPDGMALPEINVVSLPSSVGQAKRLPDILAGEGVRAEECAVILPDENLLKPVLNSIPETVRDINVTMGLPMSGSLFYTMMTEVSAIQMHTVYRKDSWFFYHKQVWDFFASDIFKKAADSDTLEIVSKVKKAAKYYIPQADLNGTPLLDAVFCPVITDPKSTSREQIHGFAEYLKDVIRMTAPSIADDPDLALEVEYAREYYKSVNVLQEIGLEVLPVTYVRLLGQLIGSVSVPFKGEPLKGLQIMGPLETRALDFRNLVIMSANEGTFPSRNVSSSFIPPELRRGFGMPTYEYQDAVWAYYFYRMISRAEKVWMFVDSRTEGIKSGEESRYIKQLEYHFGLPLKRYVVKFENIRPITVQEIEKTREDVGIIRDMTLSATSLKEYLACPAKFYFGTVRKLKPEEEVSESLDGGMVGSIYHKVMQLLYTSGSFKKDGVYRITCSYLDTWLMRQDEIKKMVKEMIMEKLNTFEVGGRDLVVTDVIVRYVLKTLLRDKEQLEALGKDYFDILGCEINVYGELFGQKFKGIIDRIDSFEEGRTRIVDYKTGKVLENDENIHDENAEEIADQIFAKDIDDRPEIALQFYVYDMLMLTDPKMRPLVEGREIFNSVYSTTGMFKDMPATVPMNRKFCDAVNERMEKLLEEMYNLDVPFRRTENEKACTYCDFKMICGR